MDSKRLVKEWFDKWQSGDFRHLPLTDDFSHTSPFGTINGKKEYLDLVNANKEKFLGHTFYIHDALYGEENACVRYTAVQGDFSLDVSEWYYFSNNLIKKIIAYYHMGEIRDERKLSESI